MTSTEINKQRLIWLEKLQKACELGDVTNATAAFKSELVMKLYFLAEIAFQLAKLNEHFEMVDNSVFGGKK